MCKKVLDKVYFLSRDILTNVKLFFCSPANVYLCVMEIYVEVSGTNRTLYGFTIVPQVGDRIFYEYVEEFIVIDVVHHIGFSRHEVTVIVEKL